MLRVCGSLQKSTEVMQSMQKLIKIPEVAATMRELSKEMNRVNSFLSYKVWIIVFVSTGLKRKTLSGWYNRRNARGNDGNYCRS